MPAYELHFSTVADAARAGSIHVKDCKHGTPRHVRVIPLVGHTLELAALDEHVLDLREREYGVRVAPCVRRAAAPCETPRRTR